MSSEPITIRQLGPEDAHILERVRKGTFDHDIDMSQAWRFLAVGVNVIVVAQIRGEVVGFASGTVVMHPDQAPAFFINEVGTHEDVQRQGIATRLMSRIRDIARDRGCEAIWVLTEDDNAPARALYRSLGGRETTGVVMYEWDDTTD